jgi:hypothetical protein
MEMRHTHHMLYTNKNTKKLELDLYVSVTTGSEKWVEREIR